MRLTVCAILELAIQWAGSDQHPHIGEVILTLGFNCVYKTVQPEECFYSIIKSYRWPLSYTWFVTDTLPLHSSWLLLFYCCGHWCTGAMGSAERVTHWGCSAQLPFSQVSCLLCIKHKDGTMFEPFNCVSKSPEPAFPVKKKEVQKSDPKTSGALQWHRLIRPNKQPAGRSRNINTRCSSPVPGIVSDAK